MPHGGELAGEVVVGEAQHGELGLPEERGGEPSREHVVGDIELLEVDGPVYWTRTRTVCVGTASAWKSQASSFWFCTWKYMLKA